MRKDFNVLILTEGGKDTGFGHITRCIALHQALEGRGIISELIINGDSTILDLLRDKEYQIFNWLREQDRLFKKIKINKAHIIIIDSYLVLKSLYERVSKLTDGRTVSIDDYNRLEYPKGIVVNPSIYGNKLDYSKKKGLVYLLGKNYIILRKEFWSFPKKKINKKIRNVLITFGGMEYFHLAKKIVNHLKKRFAFSFNIVNPRKNRFTTKDMLNLMLKTDLCISGGGQTTYELARVGVPTIGICFTENQNLNLEDWHKKGFIEYIGYHNDKDLLLKVADAIEKFIPYKKRIKSNKVGRGYVDGEGAKRIIDKMLKNFN